MSKEEASREKAHKAEVERIKNLRAQSCFDAVMNPLNIGDKIIFWSDCYKNRPETYHGEILETEKYVFIPPKDTVKDLYSEQASTRFFVKVKDVIGRETFWTLAELVEKVN